MTVSIANMSQVWMSNTNTYNAIAMSVSTMGYGANAKSKLLNLSVDGNSKFSVYTNGSIYAPGAVVQVIQQIWGVQSSTTSSTMVGTGCYANITPKSVNSKILIRMIAPIYNNTAAGGVGLGIFRQISPFSPGLIFVQSPSQATGYWGSLYSSAGGSAACIPIEYLDSPATTSQIAYTLTFARYNTGTAYINYNDSQGIGQTVITLLEIAQ